MSESSSTLTPTHPLDERYGTTKRNRRKTVLILVAAGIFAAIALVAWVVWAGLDGTSATIDTEDTAHTVIDERSVSVTFQVSVDKGTAVTCALQAQNESFAIVGWKVIDLPASQDTTRSFTETVRTSELATTGLLYRCWLT